MQTTLLSPTNCDVRKDKNKSLLIMSSIWRLKNIMATSCWFKYKHAPYRFGTTTWIGKMFWNL